MSDIFRIQCTSARSYSDALKHKEAPIVDNEVILSDKEIKERERLTYLVKLPKEASAKLFHQNTTTNQHQLSFLENPRANQRRARRTRQGQTSPNLYSSKELDAEWHEQHQLLAHRI
jgi:hypothetical protein